VIFISRMKDEGIVIGDGIVITIAEIDGDDVRLNVEHPPEARIERRDAFDAIEREVETSTQT
jgi:carbon storage regulator